MTMRTAFGILAALAVFVVAGCNGDDGNGDVEKAQAAAAKAPKSADQLPKDMPPQARAAATNAINQANAATKMGNDPGRVRAMQEMQKQHK